MSRLKHRATKLMVGEDTKTKLGIATYGELYKRNPNMCRFVEKWATLFRFLDYANIRVGPDAINFKSVFRERGRKLGRDTDLLFEVGRNADFLIAILRDAVRRGDGNVFRDIADAVEWLARPEDELRLHLLKREELSKSKLTTKRRKKALEQFGFSVGERRVRKLETELGLRVVAVPRGRRKGS